MNEERRRAGIRPVSAKSIVRLTAGANGDEVRFSAADWNLLTQVNGMRTVGEIGRRLRLPEPDVVAAFARLGVSGLVEVCDRPDAPPPILPPGLLNELRLALARVVGPLAPVLLDEAIEDLGEEPEAFPRHRFGALVEALAGQVADDSKRAQFQQATVELARRA